MVLRLLAICAALVVAACATETLTLTASSPFAYTAGIDPSLERVAIVVTVTNRSEDDLQINPADFAARDYDHRIYPANPVVALADARLVVSAARPLGLGGVVPLPVATLRKNDVLSGFIVFEVPAGVRPTQLIFRQSDSDRVVELSSGF